VSKNNLLVAIYNTHTEAEAAIKKMQSLGLDMRRLSLLGKDYRTEDTVVGCYRSRDRTRYWENLNAFGGGAWDILSGVAFFYIPEMGPFLVGGPLASSIIGSLEGAVAVRGLSAIGSGLYITGVPKDSISRYERVMKAGKYLVVVQGTEEDMSEAKAVARTTGASEFDLYQKEATTQSLSEKS